MIAALILTTGFLVVALVVGYVIELLLEEDNALYVEPPASSVDLDEHSGGHGIEFDDHQLFL